MYYKNNEKTKKRITMYYMKTIYSIGYKTRKQLGEQKIRQYFKLKKAEKDYDFLVSTFYKLKIDGITFVLRSFEEEDGFWASKILKMEKIIL